MSSTLEIPIYEQLLRGPLDLALREASSNCATLKPAYVRIPGRRSISWRRQADACGISRSLGCDSGITNPGRLKDLADVQEMIRVLNLPADFGEQLDPSVRQEFKRLWNAVQNNPSAE